MFISKNIFNFLSSIKIAYLVYSKSSASDTEKTQNFFDLLCLSFSDFIELNEITILYDWDGKEKLSLI